MRHRRRPRPRRLRSSPLRFAKGRPEVPVVIWLHCYPLCREFGVHSYSLPLLLPRFSFAKYTHTFPYHTCSFRSPEAAWFSLPPPPFLFSLSLSLFSITLPVFDVRNVYHPVQASCSPPLLDLATQIGEVSTLLHEITSLPLDLPEKICQFDRPVIFAPAHALATFPLLFAVFFPLLSVLI